MEKEKLDALKSLINEFGGLYPGIQIKDEADIKKIPVMTRDRLSQFRISDCPKKPESIHTTSGSTGKNLFVFYSKEALEAMIKRINRYFDYCNFGENDIAINLFEYGLSVIGHVVEEACQRNNIRVLPVGIPKSENFHVVVDAIKRLKPTILLSPVSLLYELFEEVGDSTIIRKINTGGSMFFPKLRENIKRMSGAEEIYDCYGCNEIGAFAVESREMQGCFNIFDDGLILEVEAEAGIFQSGTGNLLITDLNNHSMPIIRYKVGDKAEIIEKGGNKFLKFLGRSDSYTNINNQVVPLPLLAGATINLLGHDKFFFLIQKDEETNRDICTLCAQKRDLENAKMVSKALERNRISIDMNVKEWHEFPMTSSGKYINIIDKRKSLLKDRKLNM